MEELIQAKMIQIQKQEEEDALLQLERDVEIEARARIELHKLNNAIQLNNINALRLLAGCKNACWLYDDIQCFKCITGGSRDLTIKNKAREYLEEYIETL